MSQTNISQTVPVLDHMFCHLKLELLKQFPASNDEA